MRAGTAHRYRRMVTMTVARGALGAGVFGLAVASATTAGGLAAHHLGADQGPVAACQKDGLSIADTVRYEAASGQFDVVAITVNGLATRCAAKTMSAVLTNSSGTALSSGTATIVGTSVSVTMSPPASARAVAATAVVVTG